MALVRLNVPSPALGMCMETFVYMPEDLTLEDPARVLYLLHGLSDDQTMWDRFSKIELYADCRNVCVVMPNAHTSFYTDSDNGKYFTFVSRDLPEAIRTYFNVSTKKEHTYVAGLSMGGYGALKLGLTYPERFRKVFAFSGAVSMNSDRVMFDPKSVLFRPEKDADNDLSLLLKKRLEEHAQLPEIHLACGTSDFLFGDNESFAEVLKQHGVDFTYERTPGYAHEWVYWDMQVKKAMEEIVANG